ncbi:hypothetical protein Acr_00g0041390 [Actinidia rufa]|uniref:Uncharacterized protein n=1 Tax=Actinidia rufa TaxID=165716 RepID=A0A7J0DHZ8_9ERIC|nr:hypothetical protein Acr_00g0041390 [Actinidia rufa]
MTRRITKAPVKSVLQGAIVVNPSALTPGMEDEGKALKYLSRDTSAKPRSRPVRLAGEEDHLARMAVSRDIAVMYRPSMNSKAWSPILILSTSA